MEEAVKRKRKVLVVDDEPINRIMLGHIIERDYEVLYAANGKEALDVIRMEGHGLSLVMLDLLMPVMTGLELLDILKQDEELRHLPVIVLTSEAEAEVVSIRKGAADFIKKPYNMPEVILARVQRIIELSEDRQIIQAAEIDETGLYTKEFFIEYMQRFDS